MPCAPEPLQPHHLHHHHQLQSSPSLGSHSSSSIHHHHRHHHHHQHLATTTSRRPNGLFSPTSSEASNHTTNQQPGSLSSSSSSSSISSASTAANLASDFHVFDRRTAELSARAVDYLLNCHTAELRLQQQEPTEERPAVAAARSPTSVATAVSARMAATAKHELRRSSQPSAPSSPGDEDIAAIAKQISDHAEAIYQTWKSRGLAPTEILSCHSNAAAVDKFGTVLTPTSGPVASSPGGPATNSATIAKKPLSVVTSPVELLAQDNNNLEKLVNNFVVEDKARVAATRQRSPSKSLPSSIQFALQKFEQSSAGAPGALTPTTPKTPTTSSLQQLIKQQPTSFASRPSQLKTTGGQVKSPQHHSEIFLETIETFPNDVTPSKVAAVQQKVARPLVSPTANGTVGSSWPLKNKIVKPASPQSVQVVKSPGANEARQPENLTNYLDEVAREEERLINALKTGAVITEEPQPTAPKQKPAIVREKPKVEPVKPILISPSQLGAHHLNSAAVAVSAHMVSSPSNEVKTLTKDELSALSAVDYAKMRYRVVGAQQQQESPVQGEPKAPNVGPLSGEAIVSSARSKFESASGPKVDAKPAIAKDSGGKDAGKDEKDFIASRWGLRLNSSRQRPVEPVPHPELTTQQKQHIRAAAATNTGNNPVRPFLTRGSVAERVLIFEKCPSELLLDKRGPRQPTVGNWRTAQDAQNNKAQSYARDKAQPKSLPPHTTLQRHVKANRNVHIPRFYYPGGKPVPLSQVEATIARISAAFQSLPGHRASRSQFHAITKACDLPLYWKVPLFLASGGDTNGIIEMSEFLDFWKELTNSHHDAASKFVRIVTRGLRPSIFPEDLIPLVQDVVETHPGLTFLKEATEFHSRYVHTVIARIFYCVNRSWSGKISLSELRRSNLLSVIGVLEHEEDINQVTAYFSYEHFYVIYCKFWELDRDHDLFIDKMDLTRHNDHALSTRMIERIFSGAVTRGVKSANGVQHLEDKMSYTEFVWFLLSEEDKNHPTAIEYWFRCMDLDGDGYLSMYELEYFYEEQLHRMEAIGIETLPFEDCLCQMLDMLHPVIPGKISLSDLKKCKMTSIFFDTFFNLEKYLDHEQRDPFASARDHDADGHELSDWDRFAAEEYELLVAEESGNDQNDQSLCDDEM
ncbi:uncharacterized protein LOC106644311 isoform X2 [Copidosoma floridanum]|uniref:uncharacterized protein LOC106644311 isoform X2 n=1 Tax=Copidosoma floridanum TaxID=29053 RepID=UPI0006C9902E|nr:uncharacterized protein LOC106644311 isoform X2 [Copidosoma floridanum]